MEEKIRPYWQSFNHEVENMHPVFGSYIRMNQDGRLDATKMDSIMPTARKLHIWMKTKTGKELIETGKIVSTHGRGVGNTLIDMSLLVPFAERLGNREFTSFAKNVEKTILQPHSDEIGVQRGNNDKWGDGIQREAQIEKSLTASDIANLFEFTETSSFCQMLTWSRF